MSAPPGAGKTTRLPRALYDAGFADTGEILVLEPRRLAARLAAARVADEMGEPLGRTVGYTVRFESVGSASTRVRFLTEGVLTRRIVDDPLLRGVSAVVLDEFHERHLVTDLAIALLRRVQRVQRPELALAVMSATIDTGPIAAFLANAPVVQSAGIRFPTAVEYENRASDRPVEEKVRLAVSRVLESAHNGDILVFLPGAAEIRSAARSLEAVSARRSLVVMPLHGDLSAREQARAIRPCDSRKVILSTNVAESSVTIPGVGVVIDSGLARFAGHSGWNGLPTTSVRKISKASADQRAGRASRTEAGLVVRLYTRFDYESRPDFDPPEIMRSDLTETVLALRGAGVRDPGSLDWFEAPPQAALQHAEELLARLGAVDARGDLTPMGRRMLVFPVHPRLSRLLVEGESCGIAADASLAAALLSERDIRAEARAELSGMRGGREDPTGNSDVLELLDRFQEAQAAGFDPDRLRSMALDPGATQRVNKARTQLLRLARNSTPERRGNEARETALLMAVLLAFPDRVAKRRVRGSRQVLLCGGGEASLAQASVVRNAEFMVALDAEERNTSSKQGSGVLVRLASAIEPEWLADVRSADLVEDSGLRWNDDAGRVEEVRITRYDQLVIEQITRPASPGGETSRLLARGVMALGLDSVFDMDDVSSLRARVALLARLHPGEKLPSIGEAELSEAVARICAGRRSLADLKQASLAGALRESLTSRQRAMLAEETPERVALRSKRLVRVHYDAATPPWIASRMQDFFGMSETPAICGGRVRLVAHLLAPNNRPVQVTEDLRGFWKQHYPSIRRELMRRYPKHAWPEKP